MLPMLLVGLALTAEVVSAGTLRQELIVKLDEDVPEPPNCGLAFSNVGVGVHRLIGSKALTFCIGVLRYNIQALIHVDLPLRVLLDCHSGHSSHLEEQR